MINIFIGSEALPELIGARFITGRPALTPRFGGLELCFCFELSTDPLLPDGR